MERERKRERERERERIDRGIDMCERGTEIVVGDRETETEREREREGERGGGGGVVQRERITVERIEGEGTCD